jgi:CHAD domain-containing protein
MEIEAKFAVPSRAVYRELARLRMLAGYALAPAGVAQVADRYFDTADGRLLAAGYACRLRSEGDALLVTLKGIGGSQGAVHRRAEEEVNLPEWLPDPGGWPASAARTLAVGLAAGAPLEPLFSLEQRRTRADLLDGDRRVAQLSLDHVQLDLQDRPHTARSAYYELEVELAPAGTETDLASIAADLGTAWRLTPEPRSKFERALTFLRGHPAASALSLTPEERRILEAHAADAGSPYAQRAAAVLGKADGLPPAAVVARSRLSAGRVRHWVREFRGRRLGILDGGAEGETPAARAAPSGAPHRALPPKAAGSEKGQREPGAAVPRGAAVPQGAAAHRPVAPPSELLSIAELCRHYGVDLAHARFVADQARLLFDALKRVHRLPKRCRRLLRWAAMLTTVGGAVDAAHPHQAGRDLILARPIRGVSTTERLTLACIVAFSGGKVRVERESALAALDEKARSYVVPLAALVRLAEALDFSRTQTSALLAFEDEDADSCVISVTGPAAELDAAQAQSQADLWRQTFKQELVFAAPRPSPEAAAAQTGDEMGKQGRREAKRAPRPVVSSVPAAPPVVEMPPVVAVDPMSEAGRKIIYLHFTRMLANEAGTRLGEDPEALHDMRVATRRMRAAFALFAPHFDPRSIKPFGKGLRRAGRTLGAVRDLDVLMDKARAYAASLPPEGAGSLDPLLAHWATGRDVARRQMLDHLDSAAYREFVADFNAFLTMPGAGALPLPADLPSPYQVRHVAPRLILTRYESVRAYEPVLPGPAGNSAALLSYHALRIECKGLRYALEFFRDLLGDEAPALIRQVTAMQDLLGELQDAHVAETLLTEFLREQRKVARKRTAEPPLGGVEAYLESQRARQAELVAAFPDPWAALLGLEFRRRLALAVAVL